MSHGKQFSLYVDYPNEETASCYGDSVIAVLEKLGLSYEAVCSDPQHNSLRRSVDGQLPILVDHNRNDLMIWEANTILLYLAENYDIEHRFSASTPKEKSAQLQWLLFQKSVSDIIASPDTLGNRWHRSTVSRYYPIAHRTLNKLNHVLSERQWLVGDKLTIADLSFFSCMQKMTCQSEDRGHLDLDSDFPAVANWMTRMHMNSIIINTPPCMSHQM